MKTSIPITDGHVHLRDLNGVADLNATSEYVGLKRVNIVSEFGRDSINNNAPAFAAKAQYPDRFYVFASLDHTSYYTKGQVSTPSFTEQVDRMIALGADGFKVIETKPTARKWLDIPADDEYFEPFFARVEEKQFPLVWHVADPEEFWDPEKTPLWAKKRGWGYDDTFVAKEALYSEIDNVLERHPNLQVIFAHFFFLSADLTRAERLFERYKGVHFDLAPGIEMLYNMSNDPMKTSEFFTRFSDRIVFGTDVMGHHTQEQARLRAGIVQRFLETNEEYRIPEGSDFLLGPPEDGIMRGLSLADEVLEQIYHKNFERLAGTSPKELDHKLAAEECDRIAEETRFFKGKDIDYIEAEAAAKLLRI